MIKWFDLEDLPNPTKNQGPNILGFWGQPNNVGSELWIVATHWIVKIRSDITWRDLLEIVDDFGVKYG